MKVNQGARKLRNLDGNFEVDDDESWGPWKFDGEAGRVSKAPRRGKAPQEPDDDDDELWGPWNTFWVQKLEVSADDTNPSQRRLSMVEAQLCRMSGLLADKDKKLQGAKKELADKDKELQASKKELADKEKKLQARSRKVRVQLDNTSGANKKDTTPSHAREDANRNTWINFVMTYGGGRK